MFVEIEPKLLPGRIIKVTDINATIELKGRMGIVHLPLRSVIADAKLEEGDLVEIYLSYARVTEKPQA